MGQMAYLTLSYNKIAAQHVVTIYFSTVLSSNTMAKQGRWPTWDLATTK